MPSADEVSERLALSGHFTSSKNRSKYLMLWHKPTASPIYIHLNLSDLLHILLVGQEQLRKIIKYGYLYWEWGRLPWCWTDVFLFAWGWLGCIAWLALSETSCLRRTALTRTPPGSYMNNILTERESEESKQRKCTTICRKCTTSQAVGQIRMNWGEIRMTFTKITWNHASLQITYK